MFQIQLDGQPLTKIIHFKTQVYGWNQPGGQMLQFSEQDAKAWMAKNRVFCQGAKLVDMQSKP